MFFCRDSHWPPSSKIKPAQQSHKCQWFARISAILGVRSRGLWSNPHLSIRIWVTWVTLAWLWDKKGAGLRAVYACLTFSIIFSFQWYTHIYIGHIGWLEHLSHFAGWLPCGGSGTFHLFLSFQNLLSLRLVSNLHFGSTFVTASKPRHVPVRWPRFWLHK